MNNKITHTWTKIAPYIQVCEEANTGCLDYPVVGINRNKTFMPTVAKVETIDKRKYKVIKNGQFVFSGMQTGRDRCIRIGLYTEDTPALISPAYTTFNIKNDPGNLLELLPEYFFMYFKRSEMDRYGWFISDSSIRANLDWDRFLEIEIPIPDKETQENIVKLHKCAEESRHIAKMIESQINAICPALIQKVING